MRKIDMIVIHCSASRCDRDFPFESLDRYHRSLGWKGCGYHYYVTRDGRLHTGRREQEVGAHAAGFNAHSIGVCYEGGLNPKGLPADTRTESQKRTMAQVVSDLLTRYPTAQVLGHRDLPGVRKDCPCYDVRAELSQAGGIPGLGNAPGIQDTPSTGRKTLPPIRGRPSQGRENASRIRDRPLTGRENAPGNQDRPSTGRKIMNQFKNRELWH